MEARSGVRRSHSRVPCGVHSFQPAWTVSLTGFRSEDRTIALRRSVPVLLVEADGCSVVCVSCFLQHGHKEKRKIALNNGTVGVFDDAAYLTIHPVSVLLVLCLFG